LHKPAVIGHSLDGFMSFWLSSNAPTKIGLIVPVDGLPFIGQCLLTPIHQALRVWLASTADKNMYSKHVSTTTY
jgi:pimeloyl-ACP methyl ester carboxylesterase